MRTRQAKVLQFILFLATGAIILWWLYRDQDPQKLLKAIKEDVNYWWILASLLAGFMSNVSRTLRWQMLITPLNGKRPRFINTFLALTIGYLANLAIPRMGEVSRCAVLSKHEKISFTQLIGTVVAERALDILSMLISLLFVVLLQFKVLNSITGSAFDFSRLYSSLTTPIPYVVFLLLVGSLWLFRKKIRASRAFYKMKGLWVKFKEGFLSFRNVPNKPWFIGHTILIFVFYFLMMYLNFFAFGYTGHLSPMAALTVFVFGTLAMVAPVQGGIGPWHFMVITALVAYGVSSTDAGIFALVVHGALNIMIVVLGLLALLALPFVNKPRP
ncbi:MAG: flippase-like domain-containing protein [Bacteroidales bacterium]|nr:flippase-like domain-containing protein [Bacteroidales bacterium]